MKNIRISALGDISFVESKNLSDKAGLFNMISPILKKSDLVIGNLEGPLMLDGMPVPGKCTLNGDPEWARVMMDSGINMVTLANNHMMDYGVQGLTETIKNLDSAGIKYVGAGRNIKEALRPEYFESEGKKIGILGRTSVIVSSPSYAGEDQPGVAFFDLDETIGTIRTCKKQCDVVIVLMHWGIEHYNYPAPDQRGIAQKIIDAGTDLIIGHHPHVLQGMERIGKGLVAYSLGNFVFNDFEWSFNLPDGQQKTVKTILDVIHRRSLILNVEINNSFEINEEKIFTYITADGSIIPDYELYRGKHFKKLMAGLNYPFYNQLWRMYSLKREWELRIKPMLSFKKNITKITKIRFRHFKELFHSISRSSQVSSGKTTNPYE
ncbi:MAG: CapA family protein [Calditrichaceae bacterium]